MYAVLYGNYISIKLKEKKTVPPLGKISKRSDPRVKQFLPEPLPVSIFKKQKDWELKLF